MVDGKNAGEYLKAVVGKGVVADAGAGELQSAAFAHDLAGAGGESEFEALLL